MKEELISFETAKLAKEKGFNERDGRQIMYGETGRTFEAVGPGYDMDICTIAPTQSLLQKWLRDKYDISIDVQTGWENGKFIFEVYIWNKSYDFRCGWEFKTYEQALESGLKEALNLI